MTLIQLEEELKEARLRGAEDHAVVILHTESDGNEWFTHIRSVTSRSVNSQQYVGPAVVIS